MKPLSRTALAFTLLVPLVALLPLVQIGADWVRFSALTGADVLQSSAQGYDWVTWTEEDGVIRATYVLPRGPAWEAGMRKGDVFYELNYQVYFNVEDLRHAIEGIAPGSINTYSVLRDGEIVETDVRFTRYPTFIYPADSSLWHFSIWGFTVGAFLHALGLAIAVPLAWRSRRAWSTLLLILVSSLWFFSNLIRLVLVELVGPPLTPGGFYDTLWQALTLVGLCGWVAFPALLFEKVLRDSGLLTPERARLVQALIYLPAALVLLLAAASTSLGHIGPFTQAGLIGPILFHTCWFIAAAAFGMLAPSFFARKGVIRPADGWNKPGSVATLVLALLATGSASGLLPVLQTSSRLGAWLIVSTQLLSTAPILLVTIATLKHGKVDQVVTRGLTYLTVLGLIFFAFVGGMSLIDPYLDRTGASHGVVAGLYTVLLLLIFERAARIVRVYASGFFATDRQRARQALGRFQEHMRELASPLSLVQQTVQVVGQTFGVRSAVIFLKPKGPEGAWISANYHPEPPYFTEAVLERVWPVFVREPRIWARNPEISDGPIPGELARLLESRGVIVAAPIVGEHGAMGLMVLSPKRASRSVFNLDDLEMLRGLGVQLALAVERLNLIEREQALTRETAEAQLVALRAQINPHFLFNALNTIMSLIGEKPHEAEEAVEDLAAIFRHILQTSSRPFVALEEELALVQHYLAIEKARFGDNLDLRISVDPEARPVPVPAFTIQTFVENAVKHGLEKRRGPGRLVISAAAPAGGFSEVVVEDDGAGIPVLFGGGVTTGSGAGFFGIGLRNVAARLERLYGRPDLLRISSDPETGTRVLLRLPAEAARAVVARAVELEAPAP